MKILKFIAIVVIATIINLGCSSINEGVSNQNPSNDRDELVNLIVGFYNNHSDTLIIFWPGFDNLGFAVLSSNGAILERNNDFPIEDRYMQLVFSQIQKTNFMNLQDTIYDETLYNTNIWVSNNDDANYLIVKLEDKINYIRYRTGDLKKYPELRKLELFTRIIHSYARNFEHNKFIKELNTLHK